MLTCPVLTCKANRQAQLARLAVYGNYYLIPVLYKIELRIDSLVTLIVFSIVATAATVSMNIANQRLQ